MQGRIDGSASDENQLGGYSVSCVTSYIGDSYSNLPDARVHDPEQLRHDAGRRSRSTGRGVGLPARS